MSVKATHHQYTFDLFQGGIKNTRPTRDINLVECVNLIRSNTYAKATSELRNTSPERRKALKAKLDYVTFSGTFAPSRQANNIKQHSGLICLDFDNVEHLLETRLQLQADPHTVLLFTSPSGTGLKLIVSIPQLAVRTDCDWLDRHKDAFNDLTVYFRLTYQLEVDTSGSDVSRACFLPHDMEVFACLDATPYCIVEAKAKVFKQPTAPEPSKQARNIAETYAHVLAVVERIEAAQIDVSGGSGEYNQRLLLAFCMSTLGEEGRSLLHRILAFYPNYTVEETDAKFDQGRDTSRFNSPGKFFDIAKKYGIDVSAPNASAANAAKIVETSQSVEETTFEELRPQQIAKKAKDTSPLNLVSQVLYQVDECRILIKGKRGYNVVANNFLLYIKYVTEDEYENLTWILEIQRQEADPIYIEVPHDDFTSVSKLKKIITGKQYSLQLTDTELSLLQAYLFQETEFERAIKIIRYGYHAQSGVFFFANQAVFPGVPILMPDSFGMIKVPIEAGKTIFLSMPQVNKYKAHRFTLTNANVTANQFFQVFAQAHLYDNAILPFCHYLMALFRDVAIRHKNFSPILYLKGGAGTGKSSIVRVLTAAFGKKQEGVNLKSKNTESALVKLMSQGSNVVLWFDEFHNELGGIEGLLQAAYDNDGYHRSRDSTSSNTDAVEIHSALALTSNYIPDNPIFFSRCVFIPINSQDKTDDQREAFNKLQEMEEAGLGCMTVELLQHRELVEIEYATAFESLHKGLKKELTAEKVPERLISNMAQIMVVTFILASAGKVQVTESSNSSDIYNDLVQLGAANIRRQHRITAERTALTEFFEIIQSLYNQHQIHEEVHFSFRRTGNENQIRLWFPQLYSLYAYTFRRTFQKAPADKDTLQSEIAAMEDCAGWDEMKKSIRFRNDGEGSGGYTTMPRAGCCTMNYDKLISRFDLNLETRNSRV